MPGKHRAHYSGDYAKRAKALRIAATANTSTRCARCGELARDGDPWEAGHVNDGQVGGPLQAEHASCNRAAGARLGNARRKGLTTTRQW